MVSTVRRVQLTWPCRLQKQDISTLCFWWLYEGIFCLFSNAYGNICFVYVSINLVHF